MNFLKNIFLYLLFFTITNCTSSTQEQKEIIISSEGKWKKSVTAGNLITTAIRHEHKLDIVLYPSGFLDESKVSVIKVGMTPLEIESVLNLYPDLENDQFMIGSMRGDRIKRFLFRQAESNYRTEIQIAGARYDFGFKGGLQTIGEVSRRNQNRIEDNRIYRVAISNTFFFSGQTAPGYIFGFGFNFEFRRFQEQLISAKKALKSYLTKMTELPLIHRPRARVSLYYEDNKNTLVKTISEIQGRKHLSPFRGKKVRTTGVITAIGFNDRYPGAYEIYLQSPKGDGVFETSEAIYIQSSFNYGLFKVSENEEKKQELQVGDAIEITGIVYEDRIPAGDNYSDGLTRTSLREIEANIKILARNNELPAPEVLGRNGRTIPNHKISTFGGNLNFPRKFLKLTDGIDFWESLESMRVKINDPKVVGFAGGQEKLQEKGPKTFLNLFVRADGFIPDPSETPAGGLIIDERAQDFNPNIITITTHPLNEGLDPQQTFRVGEVIPGPMVGHLIYDRSFFNQGFYTLLLNNEQESLKNWSKNRKVKASAELKLAQTEKNLPANLSSDDFLIVPFQLRPKTNIRPQGDQLTVATYNLENLSNKDLFRMKAIGKSIKENMNCPDIINLVEIQDFNGINPGGGSSAAPTLESFIKSIPCTPEDNVVYKPVNIDPFPNSEGGQPGGNIRVSMLYNSQRVGFIYKPNPNPIAEVLVLPEYGQLSHNPGRVFPNDDAFRGSRKSLIAEFEFKNQRVIVIGNHFNSKLGDASLWGAQQPPLFKSIASRTSMANKINDFVERMQRYDPKVNIIVAGDFNAHLKESAMLALEGDDLSNLILDDRLVAPNDRYTTNHNGNSQGLDYILVNQNLLNKNPKIDILHVNSDYMLKHSDHDPLVAGFTF